MHPLPLSHVRTSPLARAAPKIWISNSPVVGGERPSPVTRTASPVKDRFAAPPVASPCVRSLLPADVAAANDLCAPGRRLPLSPGSPNCRRPRNATGAPDALRATVIDLTAEERKVHSKKMQYLVETFSKPDKTILVTPRSRTRLGSSPCAWKRDIEPDLPHRRRKGAESPKDPLDWLCS
eukprot:Polyplicarium_translucidae@DN2243_c0_g1_i2.p1